jgi:succinate dehydrogenase/fumarate reductase cytochrome b subunit
MGFSSESTWYQAFFMRNFGWIFAVFAYMTVILGAMQVGLGIEQLQGNQPFQRASRGFVIWSLLIGAFGIVLVFFVWNFLFFFHLIWAWRNLKKIRHQRTEELSI